MSGEQTDIRERMETAITTIRHEGWKAGLIYALVDAVAAMLAVNLAVIVFDVPWTPPAVSLGVSLPDSVGAALGSTGPLAVPGPALLGIAVAVVVLAGEFAWRVRQPLIERFEDGNPEVTDALRTARDAVERDVDSEMARRLYADVLDRLQETSSIALVDLRRVSVTVVIVLVLSVATVQATVYDVTVAGSGDDAGIETADNESVEFSGLQDGSSVLGDESDVQSGEENLTARLDSTKGDEEINDSEDLPDTTTGVGGPGADSSLEGQQAGFTQQEEVENAQLVREYNVRIRDQE